MVRERSAKGARRRETVVGVVWEDRDGKVKDGRVERGSRDVEAFQSGSDGEQTVNIFENVCSL